MEALIILLLVGVCIFVGIKCSDCGGEQYTKDDLDTNLINIQYERLLLLLDRIGANHKGVYVLGYDDLKKYKDSNCNRSGSLWINIGSLMLSQVYFGKWHTESYVTTFDEIIDRVSQDIEMYEKYKSHFCTQNELNQEPKKTKTKKTLSSKKKK